MLTLRRCMHPSLKSVNTSLQIQYILLYISWETSLHFLSQQEICIETEVIRGPHWRKMCATLHGKEQFYYSFKINYYGYFLLRFLRVLFLFLVDTENKRFLFLPRRRWYKTMSPMIHLSSYCTQSDFCSFLSHVFTGVEHLLDLWTFPV